MRQAAIYGIEGPALTSSERRFFRDVEPAGFILFRRNCASPEQLVRLTGSLRELTGRDELPILIDQEGGRVARMRPPEWPAFPAAEKFANLYRVSP
ncbi:MAG TPA: beta-hexosaminidase, partial [Sphingomicrobium sp.]|nr:beta-hexosaminidase [Sphingomicrobium sp.]